MHSEDARTQRLAELRRGYNIPDACGQEVLVGKVLAAVAVLMGLGAVVIIVYGTRVQCLVTGAILAAIGVPLLVLSRLQLGKSFAVTPKASILVKHGLYSKIPHPMYTFLDLSLLGGIIALRIAWLVAPWFVLVSVQSWQARREARVLEQAFGDAYRNYRARTWW